MYLPIPGIEPMSSVFLGRCVTHTLFHKYNLSLFKALHFCPPPCLSAVDNSNRLTVSSGRTHKQVGSSGSSIRMKQISK